MNILVSACLMGIRCKYNGENNRDKFIASLAEKHTIVPVCPEQLGGLPTPRIPSERSKDMVISKDGKNVTRQYTKGAEETLKIAHCSHCMFAILKERSPSCGSGEIYDGTFTKAMVHRDGVTAELLRKNGVVIFHERQPEAIQQWIIEKEQEDANEQND